MSTEITLTDDQQRVLKRILDFVDSEDDRVFILKGYAGTGKTTLLRFLIKELDRKDRNYRLVAPTGRAASSTTFSTATDCRERRPVNDYWGGFICSFN